jgi:hypothetical protein
MEAISNEVEDRLLKRFTVLKKLEYYITESVYYRSNSEDMKEDSKLVVWKFGDENGKIHLL